MATLSRRWGQPRRPRRYLLPGQRARRLHGWRTRENWACLRIRYDGRYKTVASPLHCSDVPRALCRIPQRSTQLTDGHAHYHIADGRLGPDGVQQGIFGHQAFRVADQIMQHVKSFGRESNNLRATPETGVGRIEAEVAKTPLRSSHSRTSLGPVLGATIAQPQQDESLVIPLY